ncbi:MAG: hypothetical protein IH616_14635 [Gemmatimonadales bacterium]|nr:hypothetical protein [Gemmatimonadales bacterium]
MHGCVESGSSLVYQRLDEAVEALVPAVSALLERAAAGESITSESDDVGHRFVAPLRFPDGIGRGTIVCKLFRYRDKVRIDVELVHNRMFARNDGAPSDRRCYLNDFVASSTVPADARELSTDFVRSVLRGIKAAREGVQRHNRTQSAPWSQVMVAAQDG